MKTKATVPSSVNNFFRRTGQSFVKGYQKFKQTYFEHGPESYDMIVKNMAVDQTWLDPYGIPHKVTSVGVKGVVMLSSLPSGSVEGTTKVTYYEIFHGWRQQTNA